jgi:hypothetical protein
MAALSWPDRSLHNLANQKGLIHTA